MKIALAWMDLSDSTDRTIVEGLVPELQKLNYDLTIVGPRRHPHQPFLELKDQVLVYRVGFYFLRHFQWLNDILSAIQLLWIHKKESVDLWHCHVFGRSYRALRWATQIGKWKLLVSIQFPLREHLSFTDNLKDLQGLAKRAYYLTALSQASISDALRLCPDLNKVSVGVVHNGGHLSNSHAHNNSVQQLQQQVSKPYILSVARLARYKGVDLLIMAFAKLLDEGYNEVHLVICGYDHLHGGLTTFIQDLGLENRVHLTGRIPRVQVTQLLQECLFMVLASREEPFGMAIVEAMAAGKPVLATAVGGIPEIVRDGIDGILVPPNNVNALAQGLRQLLEDPILRERLSQSAKQRSQEFSWNRVAGEYASLYQKGNGHEKS